MSLNKHNKLLRNEKEIKAQDKWLQDKLKVNVDAYFIILLMGK